MVMGPEITSSTPERVPVTVYASSSSASRAVAREISDLIRAKSKAGEKTVLGLATGSTPQGVYEELVRLHREEGLSFKDVVSFNLDEYWPMAADELQSYRRFMAEHLFDLVDIDPANAHVPDGTVPRDDVEAYCERYWASGGRGTWVSTSRARPRTHARG
jgi:glucosamine-6-phosphate deaminase